jgi:hypothetical protein
VKRLFPNRTRLLAAGLVVALAGLAQIPAGRTYCRSEFRRYFEGLGATDARVNPVERVIFSLLLTKTRPDGQTPRPQETPAKQL